MKNSESIEFNRITLSLTGSAAFTREYEIIKTKKGMEASLYEGGWNYNTFVTRRSCRKGHASWGKSEYEALAGKLRQIGVAAWDGFSKSNPRVLDGESFSLEIELAEGRVIRAHGNNSYPKNYREFVSLLEEAVNGPKDFGEE